jgi:inorganic pyrophosphatase
MRRNRGIVLTGVLLVRFLMAPVHAGQGKDPLVAGQYTLVPGNRTTVADTLVGEHNVFLDFAAKNDDGTVNAAITIPAGTTAKWEIDVKTGRLFWGLTDKVPRTVDYLGFPCNYGIVPRTRGGDGGPLDILVMGGMMLRGATAPAKILGLMNIADNGKSGRLLLAVMPGSFMGGVNSLIEFNAQYPGLTSLLTAWFSHYKGTKAGFSVSGFGDVDSAQAVLDDAIIDTNVAAVPAVYSEYADDSLTAEGFTRKPGTYITVNGVPGSCDTLFSEKNLFHDFPAKNDDGTINAVIEIPAGTNAKWETDHGNGRLFWENKNGGPRVVKFLGYPGNYGMIPSTYGGDGDPLDVIVIGNTLLRGMVAPARVIGAVYLVDQDLVDDKLIAVMPGAAMGDVKSIAELDTRYPGVTSIISSWFVNYKGIGGGLSSNGYGDVDTAMAILDSAISRFAMPVKRRSVFARSGDMFKLASPNRAGTNGFIEFSLPRAERVAATMYAISGEKIAKLVDDRFTAGPHGVSWNARNIPAGFYIMKMQAGVNTRVEKIFLYL